MKLKSSLIKIGFFLFLSFFGCTNGKEEVNDKKPNFVLIIADDQAWTDYSFMGHPHIETPHIDQLASESLAFTRGYLPAPVCRPSLASITTGLYPHQHGVTGNDPGFKFDRRGNSRIAWLQARDSLNKEITQNFRAHPAIQDMLKEEGYLSFQTGKWWEGSWKDGGFTGGMTHGDPARGGRHGDEGLTIGREGLQPIKNFLDTAEAKGKPFFLYHAPFMPHTPHTPPDSLLAKYMERTSSKSVAKYWAMIEWFDITVGQLFHTLDERGLTENTMVIYVCDNGWVQDPEGGGFQWPSKQSPYDMGIRTPVFYKWPGHINPKMDTSTFVSSLDIAPTILKAAGMEPTEEMQGINVLNEEKLNERDVIFSEDYNHDIADVDNPTKSLEHRVIIKKPWKLIVPRETGQPQKLVSSGGGEFIRMIEGPELYNIVNDPFEKKNVASEHPAKVSELQKELDNWWQPEF